MSDTRTPDLLDVLRHTESYEWPELPAGHVYGWRSITPDHRSRGGFRWPWPGQTAVAPDDGRDLSPDTAPDEPCPSRALGGLCLAVTWQGARSGGVPATTCLLVAYRADDVLGRDDHKLRVSRCVVLDVVNLTTADLGYADLRGADLWGADLRDADLRDADLWDANLRDADLRGADLRDADLGDANLRDANLRDADLRDANLRDANLRDADLRGANLRDADLWGADLRGANLRGADRSSDHPPVPGWRVVDGRLEADR